MEEEITSELQLPPGMTIPTRIKRTPDQVEEYVQGVLFDMQTFPEPRAQKPTSRIFWEDAPSPDAFRLETELDIALRWYAQQFFNCDDAFCYKRCFHSDSFKPVHAPEGFRITFSDTFAVEELQGESLICGDLTKDHHFIHFVYRIATLQGTEVKGELFDDSARYYLCKNGTTWFDTPSSHYRCESHIMLQLLNVFTFLIPC